MNPHPHTHRLAARLPAFSSCLISAAVLAVMSARLHAVPFSTPSVAWAGTNYNHQLHVADVNTDGLPDLAMLSGSAGLLWFVNTGGGNFTTSYSLGVSGWDVVSAQTADLDRDGDADVILVLRNNDDWNGNGQMAIFRNNGGTGFTNIQQFATGGFPAYGNPSPVAADLDNDGDLDVGYLYCPKVGDAMLAWRSNNGSGIFAAPVTLDTTTNHNDLYWADSFVAGELNGDGENRPRYHDVAGWALYRLHSFGDPFLHRRQSGDLQRGAPHIGALQKRGGNPSSPTSTATGGPTL